MSRDLGTALPPSARLIPYQRRRTLFRTKQGKRLQEAGRQRQLELPPRLRIFPARVASNEAWADRFALWRVVEPRGSNP